MRKKKKQTLQANLLSPKLLQQKLLHHLLKFLNHPVTASLSNSTLLLLVKKKRLQTKQQETIKMQKPQRMT